MTSKEILIGINKVMVDLTEIITDEDLLALSTKERKEKGYVVFTSDCPFSKFQSLFYNTKTFPENKQNYESLSLRLLFWTIIEYRFRIFYKKRKIFCLNDEIVKADIMAITISGNMDNFVINLDAFQYIYGQWSDATFGNNRKALASLNHLKKEVNEILEAPNDISEYADCFLLLTDAARLVGFSITDIYTAMRDKFEINKSREWGKPDENGVVEHIRD